MAKKYSIYIVEDEAIARASLEATVQDLGYELSGSAADADVAFADMTAMQPDILLLDINLGAVRDGVWLAKKLLEAGIKVEVIYLTAYGDSETIRRVKETQPKAYLKKPYDETTLCTTIDLIAAQIEAAEADKFASELDGQYVVVRDVGKNIRIDLAKLMYLQSDGNYVRLGLRDATYFIRASLKWFTERLPVKQFVQIHRSTMVNVLFVTAQSTKEVQVGDMCFRVSDSYRSSVKNLL